MKRTLPSLTICALLVGGIAAAGCSRKSTEDENKLIVMHAGTKPSYSKIWQAAIDLLVKDHPEVTVAQHTVRAEDYGQGGYLIKSLRSNRPPDVYFEWAHFAVRRDARSGNALDLTPFIDEAWKATLDPRAWDGTSYEGRTYMIPVTYDVANALWYNKAVLAKHEVELPETWGNFVEACKKLKARGVEPIVHGNQNSWPAGNWAAEFAARYLGIERYARAGEPGSDVKLNDPGFVKSLALLEELASIGAFNSDILTMNDTEAVAHFTSGRGAFHFNGDWIMEDVLAAGGHEKFGLMMWPPLPDEPEGPKLLLANAAGYMVHAKSKHPRLAVALLRQYMSEPVQLLTVKEFGHLSSNLEAIKALPTPLQRSLSAMLKAVDVWVPPPDIAWHKEIFSHYYTAVRSVVAGKATAREALDAAADVVAKIR